MPQSKNIPCSVRLFVTEEVHNWLKVSAAVRSEPITTFARGVIVDAMEREKRGETCRSTDPLIKSMHPLIEAMAEKLGVEVPEKQPDSEGENSAEKEGEIHKIQPSYT